MNQEIDYRLVAARFFLFLFGIVTALAIASFISGCGEGPKGSEGPIGLSGDPGPQGLPGASGTSCEVVQEDWGVEVKCGCIKTADTELCQTKASVANGIDASQIKVVQFCQGTTTYPSIFPEVGFCIEGKLYAVYSQNDGFLTELPAGTYLSSAVGSSCNFQVEDGCKVEGL